MIQWESKKNDALLNPRIPTHEKVQLEKKLSTLKPIESGSFIFGTSGSTGAIKWVVLSKKAVLASAKAVNIHLQSTSSDRWLNPLPTFHVGGLGIHARAHLSGAQVFDAIPSKWDAEAFIRQIDELKITLTSLVPAQVFDLIHASYQAPPSLRAVVVGGGALTERLYMEAINKGWPLLPSYGLTECASQVATAEIGSWEKKEYPSLKPLEHVQLECTSVKRLKVKSPALLEGYLSWEKEGVPLVDPKEAGWFVTEDVADIHQGKILKIQREGTFLKIGGESVDMARLESIFEEIKLSFNVSFDAVLVPVPDLRLGNVIHLVVCEKSSKTHIDRLLEALHIQVFPYERVRQVHVLPTIPRSDLKKVIKKELLEQLLF